MSVAARPGAIADAPSRTRAGVFGIARMTATPEPAAASIVASRTPAAIDSNRVAPADDGGSGSGRDVGGLHGKQRRARRRHLGHHRDPGEQLGQLGPATLDHFDHDDARGVHGTRGEQPSDQRRAHVAAADDRQLEGTDLGLDVAAHRDHVTDRRWSG